MEQQQPFTPTPRTKDPVARNYAAGVLVALLVTVSFIAGVFFGDLGSGTADGAEPQGTGQVLNTDAPPPEALKDVDFRAFWEVWKMVKERYVAQPTSDVDMFYGSIAGMVASLGDPYSLFFDPEFAAKFTRELAGTFDGIGAEIGIKQNQLTVIAPLAGTPAERAGLQAGDKILAIDDVDTSGMTVEDAVTRIRGEKGTQVKLLIIREDLEEAKEFLIMRDTIVVQSVKWSMKQAKDKRVAVVTISHFNENTEGRFNEAVRALLLEDPDGLVLDLRNNPGGFLDTAVSVAGEWVHEDVVVVEKFSDGKTTDYPSSGIARLADIPTVVLVNEGSASASEIVAGALQDHGKAVIVGEKTFGKGSVQDYVEFNDGSALKLTIALWLTPAGRSINEAGIEPDVMVEMTTEDFNADRDPQLDRALEVLAGPSS